MDRSLLTPAAIILAGAMIAGAVYLGLRSREAPPSAAPTPATAAPVGAPAISSVASSSSSTMATPSSREAVATAAGAALANLRGDLARQCWKPAVTTEAGPLIVRYVFHFTFDADGQQIARGVSEDRAAARPEVTQCVLQKLPTIRVPAPGAVTAVDVGFELP